MKNPLSLLELISVATTFFKNEKYTDINVVHCTEDGFPFIEENRARVHCAAFEGLKFHTITRTEALQGVRDLRFDLIVIDDVDKDPETPAGEQKTDQNQKNDQDPEAEAKELEELKAQYQQLYGKAAHHNVGAEKLKTLIAEKQAETGDQKPEGGETQNQTA